MAKKKNNTKSVAPQDPIIEPITHKEIFLSKMAGQVVETLPDPITHEEMFLKKIGDRLDRGTEVISITDTSITMQDISNILDQVNAKGQHVWFDVSALQAKMYLCTIFIDEGFYRIFDLVTGFEKKGFFQSSDLLLDILKGGSVSTAKHYTVQWDKTNAQCVRLNDAQSITTNTANFGHFGSLNGSYDNPFDSIYPWSGRKLCNIDINAYMALTSEEDITDCVTYWEDDAGFSYSDSNGVWVYTPSFFGRSFSAGNYVYFDVTDELTQENITYPASLSGRWQGRDVTLTIDGVSKHCLIPSVGMPAKRIAMADQHTYAKNFGATLDDIYSVDATTLLFVVEFATMNSQTALGNGCTDVYIQSSDKLTADTTASTVVQIASSVAGNVIPNAIFDIGTSNGGANVASALVVSKETDPNDNTKVNVTLDREVTATTNHYWSIHGIANVADEDIGSKSGYIGTNSKVNTYYRGQVIFGNIWFYVLGAYRQTGTGKIWIAQPGDTDNYDALDTTKHTNTNLVLLAGASNYISKLGSADGLAIPPFCTAVGGNSTNPVGDYCYVPSASTSNTVLLLGGSAGDGTRAGRGDGNWNSDASDSYWNVGARPRLINP